MLTYQPDPGIALPLFPMMIKDLTTLPEIPPITILTTRETDILEVSPVDSVDLDNENDSEEEVMDELEEVWGLGL